MATDTIQMEPGPIEVRLYENVYLGDVAAALPHDTMVTVVGRCTVVDAGARRFDDVEHAVLIPDDAYAHLKTLGVLPRAKKGAARSQSAGVTPRDLARSAETWAERAARFERLAEDADSLRMNAAEARRAGELCRQIEAELDGLRQRAEAAQHELAEAA